MSLSETASVQVGGSENANPQLLLLLGKSIKDTLRLFSSSPQVSNQFRVFLLCYF